MLIIQYVEAEKCAQYQEYVASVHRPKLLEASQNKAIVACEANILGKTIGFAFGEYKGGQKEGHIYSVYVIPKMRRKGIATRLLQHVENKLRKCGAKQLKAFYFSIKNNGEYGKPQIEQLLLQQGWSDIQPSYYSFCINLQAYMQLPWTRKYKLPKEYSMKLWKEVPVKQLQTIRAGEGKWYTRALSPFKLQEVGQKTSLALYYKGKVIGWCISSNKNIGKIVCEILFAREPFQTRGRSIPLLTAAIQLAIEEGFNLGVFTVNAENKDMLRFVNRRMYPSVQEESLQRVVVKL